MLPRLSNRQCLALALLLFGLVVAIGLLQPTGLFAPLDKVALRIVGWLRYVRGAGLVTRASELLDQIGQGGGRLYIALVIGTFLAGAGRPRAMLWLLVTVAPMIVINASMKLLFLAPRPDMIEPLLIINSNSFPSGHAAGAMTLYGAIALLGRSRMLWLSCAGMILATGLSRVWLGVHWPTDVIAGWLEGAAWLAIMSLYLPNRGSGDQPARIASDTVESSTP